MKKKFFLLTILSAGALMLASCGAEGYVPLSPLQPGDDGEPHSEWVDYSTPISEIRIADREIILDNVGDSAVVEFAVSPRNAIKSVVEWTSSDQTVATVSKDLETGVITVTGISGGECEIYAKSGTVTDSAHVTVNIPLQDFEIAESELNLDYFESYQIEPTFIPAETTFTDLTWTVSDPSITVVHGLVTAGDKTITNGTISVTSEQLDKVVVIHVNITDKWNYVADLEISSESHELEVDRSMYLESVVTAVDPTHEASTLTKHSVKYSSLTPEIISVDEDTGEVTALEAGQGKVQALLLDERSELTVFSNELSIDVYEVKAKSISIKDYSKQVVELDNKERPSITLEPEYELDDSRAVRPSRGHLSFASQNPEIASVDENGVVTALSRGETTVEMRDSYSNQMDYVTINVTIHSTAVSLSAPTDAGVGEAILLKATITPAGVSNPSLEFESLPSEGVTIINNGDGTATAISDVSGLVFFTATNDGVTSNYAQVNFKHEFKDGKIYVVGSKNYASGTSASGESWEDAGKAFILSESTEPTPEGYTRQLQGRITFDEGDQFKFRNGTKWLDTIEWLPPSEEGGEWTRVDHIENSGAVLAGKFTVVEDSQGYGNIVTNVAGTYDIYFKEKLGGYDVYIGDAPVFRFEYAPKTVEVGKSVVAKVSDGVGTVSVSKNNDNIAMTFDQASGEINITGLVVGESTLITAKDDEKEISHEIKVVEQKAEYTLAGSFNGWNGADQNYGLHKVSDGHYVIEDVTFAVGDQLQAVSAETGQWFGNNSTYDGCHYTLENDGYGKNKLIIDYAATYDVHIYIEYGNGNPIYLAISGDTPEPPAPVTEYYLKGSFNNWEAQEQYKFVADSEDTNKFVLENVDLHKDYIVKANNPALGNDGWYGVKSIYDNCNYTLGESGNAIISETATYDVYLYVNSTDGNHLQFVKHGEPVPPPTVKSYYLLGTINEWTVSDNYKFTPDTSDSNKFVLEDVTLAKDDVIKVNEPESGAWYGVASEYQNCHYTVGENSNCVIADDGTYDVEFYLESSYQNYIKLIKKGDTPEPPVVIVEYYLKGTFNDWTEEAAYKFVADAESDNKFLLANVELTKDDEMKGYNPSEAKWFGVDHPYDNCHFTVGTDGNCVVAESGTYDVILYVSSNDGNHLQLVKHEEPQPPVPVTNHIKFTMDVGILASKFSHDVVISGYSLYAWCDDSSEPLGNFDSCYNNISGGSVEFDLSSERTITGIIIYLWEGDNKKQSVNLEVSINEAGEYYVIIPETLSWEGDHFGGITFQKA